MNLHIEVFKQVYVMKISQPSFFPKWNLKLFKQMCFKLEVKYFKHLKSKFRGKYSIGK